MPLATWIGGLATQVYFDSICPALFKQKLIYATVLMKIVNGR